MKKSFTLIELLIVASITLIFLGVSLVQYNTYTEQTKLINDGKKLLDVIELAKKKALSSDLQDKNCSNFTGYRLTLNANNYSLIFCCNSICTTNTNIYNFNTNISIFSGTGNLSFPPLMTGANITINSVQLKNSAINKCINISISSIGVVELNETLIGC
ncbi:hypothetical protein HZA75_07840 [Candidatus Roizmanbacteria bacterium]|nr:hypothetical protein [Candidatus Roizmanbacteria bacterium]